MTPAMSVILVTADRFETLRRTVRTLRSQTVRDRIELILVGPRDDSFDDMEPEAVEGFAACRTLSVGPVVEVERGFVPGIERARAPVLALLENHVYPDPDWAERMLEAHDGPWVAVSGVIRNANPATAASWVEHFLTYGFHDETAPGGEVPRIARNNGTYKRAALAAFGEELPDLMARDGGLMARLKDQGGHFYRETRAGMDHLNPSRARSILGMRVPSARASAATRARTEGWSPWRRAAYVAVSPIFPILRLRALWPRLRAHPRRDVLPRIAPLFAVALVTDALGQTLGFAFGPGDSAERTGQYDLDRIPFLSDADRARFAG